MFRDREDAARRLANELQGRPLHDPLVLAIPRGGVVGGAVLARELGGDLDVILSRKLRAPGKPECALGAVSETGEVHLNSFPGPWDQLYPYLVRELAHQTAEIDRRKLLYRAARPRAPITGRSVIVTDDGVATGATMIAALKTLAGEHPHEVLVAVPVAPAHRLRAIKPLSDEVVCLLVPARFLAVGQFYRDFTPVGDERVTALLRPFARRHRQAPGPLAGASP